MKAKQTPVQLATVTPRSFKDAGYQTATLGEGRKVIAQYVLEQCPTFLDTVPDEVKAELFAGFQLRHYELTGNKTYRMGDTGALIPDPDGGIEVNTNVAMAYTSQAFGQLRKDDPALHGLIEVSRKAFSKYASNCMADLRSACKRLLTADQPRERAVNKGFNQAVTDAFDGLDKRAKVAQARGDDSADPVRFRMAVDAFWKAYAK
jgi:hypothetical protein